MAYTPTYYTPYHVIPNKEVVQHNTNKVYLFQLDLHIDLFYHTSYHTMPYTIPYHVIHHTVYHNIHRPIPCTIPYTMPYTQGILNQHALMHRSYTHTRA